MVQQTGQPIEGYFRNNGETPSCEGSFLWPAMSVVQDANQHAHGKHEHGPLLPPARAPDLGIDGELAVIVEVGDVAVDPGAKGSPLGRGEFDVLVPVAQ